MGYDHPTGKRGFIPSSDYYNRWYNNSWGASTTISNSIGQGEVLTTPIQLANFAAIIANKGWYIQPHFVKHIENDSIDKNYKIAFDKAVDAGVKILCYDCKITHEEVRLNSQISIF